MKRNNFDAFEKQGRELIRLALKLDSNFKLEDGEDQKERSSLIRARRNSIMALDALIKVVSTL